jgi:hypothetical protein
VQLNKKKIENPTVGIVLIYIGINLQIEKHEVVNY